ncbi:ImmA/IrrE family metallo-endopeptidase [Cupriavidus sp. GA3-3]|uniref:ImmA/IrrE family metallo-endopeptidase n=1 Tax=Cupriavidus sp. GA3-3 TaxID=1229514 RepID=UPI00056D4501|nr:ImmA/IrrE family metallo-endopeptidase [Cupriavidus sp. GA3-3]
MRTESVVSSAWAVPPGQTIRDLMVASHLSTDELAQSIDLSPDGLDCLLEGTLPLTEPVAERLASVFGATASFWLCREAQYRAKLQVDNVAPDHTDEHHLQWMKGLPVKDMMRFGWLEESASPGEQLQKCLEFFGVPSLEAWNVSYGEVNEGVAFRTSETYPASALATAAWLRQGELLSSKQLHSSEWNPQLFRKALSEARTLTLIPDPSEFVPKLQTLCAAAGVSVVVVRAPTGCRASGATYFMEPSKAVLMLSGRYLTDDHFWFSFFHEAGHLLLHWDAGSPILETAEDRHSEREAEANQFAADMLLPNEYQDRLPEVRSNLRGIIRLARDAGVSRGIVVGQLQHRGLVKQGHFNDLKARYKWH